MKEYSTKISLVRNGRGVYCIDTTMGCASGMAETIGGCYGDCYAFRTAKRYGHDFTKTILRSFTGQQHKREILSQIAAIKMPFIRIGCSGDPSENWVHTINVLRTLFKSNTEIIIITRHWNLLNDEQLNYFSIQNICINTSVSALDSEELRERSLEQYHRIKPYCKSVLRIISCDFNLQKETGRELAEIQRRLFKNESTIDTVFRPSKRSLLITNAIINVRKEVFNGKQVLASKFNRKTFMGKCSLCKEMCGVNVKTENNYPNKRGIIKQLSLWNT